MPALLNVVILLHETGSQGEPFGPEIKTFTILPEDIYNSHYGNGVPAMFTS